MTNAEGFPLIVIHHRVEKSGNLDVDGLDTGVTITREDLEVAKKNVGDMPPDLAHLHADFIADYLKKQYNSQIRAAVEGKLHDVEYDSSRWLIQAGALCDEIRRMVGQDGEK